MVGDYVTISTYPHPYEKEKTWSAATTFNGADLIMLNPVPKRERKVIPKIIEKILVHESLHIVIAEFDSRACDMLDNVFPMVDDLESFLETI